MKDLLDRQAARLNEYLGRMGIRLTPERTREAVQHTLVSPPDADVPGGEENRTKDIDRWAASLGVTPEALREAMTVVGTQPETVERFIRTGSAFPKRPSQPG